MRKRRDYRWKGVVHTLRKYSQQRKLIDRKGSMEAKWFAQSEEDEGGKRAGRSVLVTGTFKSNSFLASCWEVTSTGPSSYTNYNLPSRCYFVPFFTYSPFLGIPVL